jgi:regulator of chromosome condensation
MLNRFLTASRNKHSSSAALPEPPQKRQRTVPAPISLPPSQELDIYVFGAGEFGELGLGSKPINGQGPTNVRVPRHNKLLDSFNVTQIAVGGMHCVGLTRQGQIVTWGVNDHGALGRDTVWEAPTRHMDEESGSDEDEIDLNPKESTPTAIPETYLGSGEYTFVQVAATNSASFALTTSGQLLGWGTFSGDDGAVGFLPESAMQAAKTNTDEQKLQRAPVLIPHLSRIISLATGNNHVLALSQQGRVYAWGAGGQCQLGLRTRTTRYTALSPHILTLTGIKQVACGGYHSFAIADNGLVYSWGLNNFGQTGISQNAGEDDAFIAQPTVVESLRPYKICFIKGGEHHSIACTANGEILVWGRCDDGQAGIPLDNVPKEHLVLDSRERPRILLRPTVVEGIKGATAVAAGVDTSFAVDREGKAWSWGYGDGYRTGLGTGNTIGEASCMAKGDGVEKRIVFVGAGGQFGVLGGIAES